MAKGTAGSVLESLSNDLAAAVEHVGRSVVAIHARRRIPASGIVWGPGIVAAANHTIHRDDDISVSFADGRTVEATLRGRDPATDLAVLTIAPSEADADAAPIAERGDATDMRVGAMILALGRPGGSVTASLGVISSVGGEWRTWHGGRIDQLIRLDVGIYDGFSGGPLVSAGGKVLGINTSALSRGSALTIPSSTVDRVSAQLARDGRIARGYLGLGMQPVRLSAALAAKAQSADGVGLMVVSVDSDGPADAAGVFLGDVLVSFDGTAVSDPAQLLALLGPDAIGQRKEARIVRAGQILTVNITIGERPADRPRGRRE